MQYTPKKGWRIYRPKRFIKDNKQHVDNSPKCLESLKHFFSEILNLSMETCFNATTTTTTTISIIIIINSSERLPANADVKSSKEYNNNNNNNNNNIYIYIYIYIYI